jgi:hypothetical protein
MNVEIGTEAGQFIFWEYKNGVLVAVNLLSYIIILKFPVRKHN